MLFVAGLSLRYIVGTAAGRHSGDLSADRARAVPTASASRSFFSPGATRKGHGFQLLQSLIAVGSGGLTGVGLMESRQKLFFLPEAHTDFIFAIICEELGFIGAVVVLGAFCGVRLARICRRDEGAG